ncbi:MAG: nucleotidyltransferase family protein [Lacrimispora sp.]
MIGYNQDIETQKQILFNIVLQNKVLFEIIKGSQSFGLEHYYIGAGCICQSVWNYQNGLELMYGISDVDFVYFDDKNISYEAEDCLIKAVKGRFSHLPVEIDVKNQARVHLWYKDHYGYELQPYDSLESAINSWPTTATSIGVRVSGEDLAVYAPFGLNDMFGQIVRANKTQITRETYLMKCEKWCSKWPGLHVIEWEES